MISILKSRRRAIVLWLAMFGLAVGCSFWRLFLPNYFTTPGIWALWHKPMIALFLIPLFFLGPIGFYRWFPVLLQKLKLGSRPWLCCIILLSEALAVWAVFWKMLYIAGNAVVAAVVSTLLFLPRMELETIQKPVKWLVPSTLFLACITIASTLLPWKIGGNYALALAVGLAYSAWLILNISRKENPVNRWWLSVLPFTVVFAIALTLHAFSADAQAEVSAWRAGENFYTAMRTGDSAGSTLMNIVIPLANLSFAFAAVKIAKPNRELIYSVRYLTLLFVLMTIAGLMVFYGVVPAGMRFGVIMPFHTCFTSLPCGLLVSRFLFQKTTQNS